MKRFTALYIALDESNRTADKVDAMEAYFREAPAADAAWALFFLTGQRMRGTLRTRAMRDAALAATGMPNWMLDECYDSVGDLSETIALLLPQPAERGVGEPLHAVVERSILPLVRADDVEAASMLRRAWAGLSKTECFVFNKLVRGNFRIGVQRALVVRALARATGVDAAVMAHRLTGGVEPTAAAYAALTSSDGGRDDAARPYPFCLAHQLDRPPTDLGDPALWQVEHKWDGIRAQMIRREGLEGGVALWSRGEEPITGQFPELAATARALPTGTVLDGEVLAWRFDARSRSAGGRPLSFNVLQARLNRKDVQPMLFDAEGVVFACFDILEEQGVDLRQRPLRERRAALAHLIGSLEPVPDLLRVPAAIPCTTWEDAQAARAEARTVHNAEGLMLKHLGSAYHTGRVAGGTAANSADDDGLASGWWKWKVDPYSVDAVLVYAQQGSGKRAGLFTDYTFAVWNSAGELVPFAKAYSGLTDEEIAEVDAFIRRSTLDRKGPVRTVKPELVFEISFESIRVSPRHKSGIAVRFPRITRWRKDKAPREADTMDRLRALLALVTDRDEGTGPTRAAKGAP